MTGRVLLNWAVPVPTCIFGDTAVTCTRQFVSESGSLKVAVALPVASVRSFADQKALSAKSRRITSSAMPRPRERAAPPPGLAGAEVAVVAERHAHLPADERCTRTACPAAGEARPPAPSPPTPNPPNAADPTEAAPEAAEAAAEAATVPWMPTAEAAEAELRRCRTARRCRMAIDRRLPNWFRAVQLNPPQKCRTAAEALAVRIAAVARPTGRPGSSPSGVLPMRTAMPIRTTLPMTVAEMDTYQVRFAVLPLPAQQVRERRGPRHRPSRSTSQNIG